MAENNTDYVERAPLLAKLKELQPSVFGGPLMVRALEEAPAADVVPVVRGEWVPDSVFCEPLGKDLILQYTCSVCEDTSDNAWNYCPHCGARLEDKHMNYTVIAYAESGLPRKEATIIARDKDEAWSKAWRMFPEYHEVGVFEEDR
jgi:hypothetical protein